MDEAISHRTSTRHPDKLYSTYESVYETSANKCRKEIKTLNSYYKKNFDKFNAKSPSRDVFLHETEIQEYQKE